MRKLLSNCILNLGKCPKQKRCTFTSCIFYWVTSQGPKSNPKGDFHKIFAYLKKNQSVLVYIQTKKVKPIFSHRIFKSCVEGFRVFLKLESYFCQMACIYLLNRPGNTQCFDFDISVYKKFKCLFLYFTLYFWNPLRKFFSKTILQMN